LNPHLEGSKVPAHSSQENHPVTKKLVTAGLILAALSLPTAASAASPGAADCQPQAGQQTVTLAHLPGPLGQLAKAVATSSPGAISEMNKQDLFDCEAAP
jgi:hypothetical protein